MTMYHLFEIIFIDHIANKRSNGIETYLVRRGLKTLVRTDKLVSNDVFYICFYDIIHTVQCDLVCNECKLASQNLSIPYPSSLPNM